MVTRYSVTLPRGRYRVLMRAEGRMATLRLDTFTVAYGRHFTFLVVYGIHLIYLA
jgi:hypothetical protein